MQKRLLSLLLVGAAALFAADAVHAVRVVTPATAGTFGTITYPGGTVPADLVLSDQNSTVYTEQTGTQLGVDAQLNALFSRPQAGTVGTKCERRFGLWAGGDWTKARDKQTQGQWDSHLWTAMVGGDYRLNDRFTFGLGLMYSYQRGNTGFNRGRLHDNTYGVVPYLNVKVTNWLNVDLAGGYNRVHKERTRVSKTSISTNPNEIKGTVDSDRWFLAPFLNFTHNVDKFGFLGRLGYSYAHDHQKGFRESNGNTYTSQTVTLNRLHVRLQAAYQWKDDVKPYVFALYTHDFTEKKQGLLAETPALRTIGYFNPEAHRNKNTWGCGAGVDFVATERWVGGLEGTFKKNADVRTYGATFKIRYSF
jgi:opacity protein-like surface antigen